jgi:hypothetical protein
MKVVKALPWVFHRKSFHRPHEFVFTLILNHVENGIPFDELAVAHIAMSVEDEIKVQRKSDTPSERIRRTFVAFVAIAVEDTIHPDWLVFDETAYP